MKINMNCRKYCKLKSHSHRLVSYSFIVVVITDAISPRRH